MNLQELKGKRDIENEYKSSISTIVADIKAKAMAELSTEIEAIRAQAADRINTAVTAFEMELGDKIDSVKTLKGDNGKDGKDGPQGIPGMKGDRGETGPTGSAGKLGKPGKQGERGEMGKEGKQGVAGQNGSSDTGVEIIGKINSAPVKYKIPVSRIDGLKNQGKIKKHGGGSTSGSTSTIVRGEVVSFTGATGTLAHTPLAGVALYRGNLRQYAGALQDYTLSGAIITLITAASSGEVFIADYEY